MRERFSSVPADSLIKEAAYWVLRLHDDECSTADRQAFEGWVQTTPEHAFEFAKMLEIWEQSERLPAVMKQRF